MFKMQDKTYNILKWAVIIFLPACSVLYCTLADIYHLPCADEVARTISAICVFLGTILCISSANYNAEEGTIDGEKIIEIYESEKGEGDVKQ